MRNSDRQYSCIIIDDDFSSIALLQEYIAVIPKLKLVKAYLNPLLAISEILSLGQIDFLFLDINMSISGLDVARILRNQINFIIVITGHPEHALKSFDVQADKFLVKPISFDKFIASINQVLKKETS